MLRALVVFALPALTCTLLAEKAPPERSEVVELPGLKGNLEHKMYTGFLDAGAPPNGKGKMYVFYICALSANDYKQDPIIFWYNGGPGASSLFGFFQEWGPYRLLSNSYDNGTIRPMRNDWSWARNHTTCTFDSPPPMGFSYCSEAGPDGEATSCGPWTDSSVFDANHRAHERFFQVFPEFQHNDLYLAGESYAGIYVPGFAGKIMDTPDALNARFKGFMVGNGWAGCKQEHGHEGATWCQNLTNVGFLKYPNANPGPDIDVEFFCGEGQVDRETCTALLVECKSLLVDIALLKGNPVCMKHFESFAKKIGDFFVYNIYNTCPEDAGSRTVAPGNGDAGVSQLCLGTAMNEWLQQADTREKLSIPTNDKFWNLDNGIGFDYTTDREFVGDIYMEAMKQHKKVLLYAGETDACGLGPFYQQKTWFSYFADQMANKKLDWEPYKFPKDYAAGGKTFGHRTRFEFPGSNGHIDFVSIKGAGHLVPLNRPASALTMLEDFIAGKVTQNIFE